MKKILLIVLCIISLSCAKGRGPNILYPNVAELSYETQSIIVYSAYDYHIAGAIIEGIKNEGGIVRKDVIKYNGSEDIGTSSRCSAHSYDADWIHWEYSIENGYSVITVDENQSENIRKATFCVSDFCSFGGAIVITQYPKSKL